MTERPSILFVNQHYYPDFASTGQHLTDLAEHLAGEGFEVHVLCSRGRYLAGRLQAPKREVHHGVTIRRVGGTSFGRGSHLGRLADYASFYTHALRHVLLGRRFDAVVMLTTPPLLVVLGGLAHRLRGRRYGVWSMDLHPDAEEALGMIRPGGLAARFLHALNDWGYRGADFVVDLGGYMKARLRRKGVEAERLHTIPVWSKRDEILPSPAEQNPLRAELGLEGRFVVMYSGNAGLAHRFEEVLEAMRALREHPSLYFLFVGGGPRRAEIEAFIAEHGITNARYLDYFPREQLRHSLTLADVHLLTLRTDMAGIAVPGKLYGIMAAGRPTAMLGPEASEPAETIARERVGLVVEPGKKDSAERFISGLLDLAAHPDEARAMGRRARAAFLEHFEQEVACGQWATLLRRLLAEPAPEPELELNPLLA